MRYSNCEMNYKDCVFGTVVGGCKEGLFIRLDNDEMSFAKFNFLPSGARVLCTLLKKANKNNYALVGIDSII